MKHSAYRLLHIHFLAFLLVSAVAAQKTERGRKLGPGAQAAPQMLTTVSSQTMDYPTARRIVINTLQARWDLEVQVRSKSIEMPIDNYGRLELRTLGRVTVGDKHGQHTLLVDGKYDGTLRNLTIYYFLFEGNEDITKPWGSKSDSQALARAQTYADALNLLSAHARGEDRTTLEEGWGDFQQKAAAWRVLPTKPALTDTVRMHFMAATEAFQNKQFDLAIDEYEAGLKVDPLWPTGHYDDALLYGELQDYEWAVWHMRAYLELRPDASDAQAARDQMLLWKEKAQQ
jgi:hypothetical protein